ncbi:MAG TPA: hypothetical protein VF255_11265 [Solirubrobacterales bacterium]
MAKRLLISLVSALCFLALAAPAQAAFGFEDLIVTFEDSAGDPADQAGSHPFSMTTTINMNTTIDGKGEEVPDEDIRDLVVELPPGFVGDPDAVPTCSSEQFNTLLEGGYNTCPDASTVGVIDVRLEPGPFVRQFAVFNLQPGPGDAARIGFVGFNLPVTLGIQVAEDGTYNVISSGLNIPQSAPFYGADLTLWGNPSDPVHDPERGGCLDRKLGTPPPRTDCSIDIEPRAFLTLPRSCGGPQSALFRARSWQTENVWVEDSTEVEPTLTGCEKLEFEAAIGAQPDTTRASSPTALDFSIGIDDPGLTDPTAEHAFSDIKATRVTLPEGVAINPSQAAVLQACSAAQFASEKADTSLGQGCPVSSRVGTVEVETPLLQGRILRGNVFVATPFENPFGTLIALYMTIKEPQRGINVTLAGKVEPIETGPKAGQIVANFDNLPQLPFSDFRFHFEGGPRSALSTPTRCGTYTTEAVFVPWANPDEPFTTTSSFQISSGINGGPCPGGGPLPFDPGFSAGTVNNKAGSFSPLVMRVTKGDGQQEITRFDSILPPGVTGKIAGVAQCSEAAIAAAKVKLGKAELAAPSCPAASRLGGVTAGAGVGPELTYVEGSIYLAGPYGGSPLSIAVVTPAVAGPFDLGTVVIRAGLDLNPITAEAEVQGSSLEPIPTFLEGIPLRLRDLRVKIDRDRFTLNATGCDLKTIRAGIFGSEGSFASPSAPYQASGCGDLAFKPNLKISLKGSTTRSGHPALRSVLTPRAGDANIGAATVLLPPSEQIDNAHINNPCTRVQFNANQCPPGSVLGTARAYTPLLDQPLEGPVYFRSNGGERELPDIVAHLKGQFEIVLVGFVDTIPVKGTEGGRLRTRFLNVPDAPVSKFQLSLFGGKRGLLVNNRNLCKGKLRTKLRLSGQNGRIYNTNPLLKTSCKKGKRGGKK